MPLPLAPLVVHLIPAGRGLMNDAESKELLASFSVEKKMKEVSDNYIEQHDRTIKEIHEDVE